MTWDHWTECYRLPNGCEYLKIRYLHTWKRFHKCCRHGFFLCFHFQLHKKLLIYFTLNVRCCWKYDWYLKQCWENIWWAEKHSIIVFIRFWSMVCWARYLLWTIFLFLGHNNAFILLGWVKLNNMFVFSDVSLCMYATKS